MSQSHIFLFLSIVGWFGVDILRKILSTRISPLTLVFFWSLGPGILLLSLALLENSIIPTNLSYWSAAATSIVLNIIASIAIVVAVKKAPLSMTIPLLSLTPLIVTSISYIWLGETPSLVDILGIVAITTGTLLLGMDESINPISWFKSLIKSPGTVPMVIVVLSWSLTMPVDKIALGYSSVYWHGAVVSLGMSLGTSLGIQKDWQKIKSLHTLSLLTAGSILIAAALAFQFLAMKELILGIVEGAKRGIGNLLTALADKMFFSYEIPKSRVLALSLMTIGVFLIVL